MINSLWLQYYGNTRPAHPEKMTELKVWSIESDEELQEVHNISLLIKVLQ